VSLEVGITTNVLLVDEDVRHAALVGDFLKGILDSRAVICHKSNESQYTFPITKVGRSGVTSMRGKTILQKEGKRKRTTNQKQILKVTHQSRPAQAR